MVPLRQFMVVNIVVLVLMSWMEMVEEIYFRGYLQRQMTERMGACRGIVLSLPL